MFRGAWTWPAGMDKEEQKGSLKITKIKHRHRLIYEIAIKVYYSPAMVSRFEIIVQNIMKNY